MGQQQILLVVLGVILVAIALAVGFKLFKISAMQSNRDLIINDLNFLASDLQAYYKKTSQMGGGSGNYSGWQMPNFYKRYENGRIRVTLQAQRDRVILNGTGTEIGINNRSPVRVQMTVTPGKQVLKINN
ncbi:MAG: hypothetical protein HXY49_05250 [Ignavibacteriaceae bacterium]|nr:hypothetical protein [Ignavibacteriaceae bacterium]